MSDNTITVTGNLTRDPEFRMLDSGQGMCKIGIASARRWKNKRTDEWEEETSFFDVIAWGELGENAAESLRKGMRAIVTGTLEQRSWVNNDGEKRSKVQIRAEEIGPSLRWATASVARTERKDAQQQRPAQREERNEPTFDDEEPW